MCNVQVIRFSHSYAVATHVHDLQLKEFSTSAHEPSPADWYTTAMGSDLESTSLLASFLQDIVRETSVAGQVRDGDW